ncbi:MAG: exodeoxyribonuclease VII large subunit [Oscillospiraceae bacterium]|nr:exodeoxyribonuclease VII large subunit [Oscillospiraceae bacterium]
MNENETLSVSVSEVNRKIADLLKNEKSLSGISVNGEISNFTGRHKTGHLYFTLKDETSSIKAIMFKGSVGSLKFEPENGMKVTVKGDVRVFERDGQYQLYAFEMQPEGMGALYVSFLELRERLEKEGLFSQKRPLPKRPETIAVITAETGAALQDILNTLSRRNPLVKVILIPASVQGVNAPGTLISAFNAAQSTNADLLIFGRGGGSIEDLWAFNDEKLARTIFASRIPTISAVGHEVDFTIGDFVADLRAATPTAAAEISVPDISEIYDALTALKSDLRLRFGRLLSLYSERVGALERELHAKSPTAKLSVYTSQLEVLERQIKTAMGTQIGQKRHQLIAEMKRVDALSPLNVLMRGYSIVSDSQNKAVTDSAVLNIGDRVGIKLHKGKITAEVIGKFE